MNSLSCPHCQGDHVKPMEKITGIGHIAESKNASPVVDCPHPESLTLPAFSR